MSKDPSSDSESEIDEREIDERENTRVMRHVTKRQGCVV